MTFLNPLILIGLVAGSIPFILHLLNLRKLKTIEFSTLRFLKELQKTRIRRLKLKQLILLILRTAIIIFAVFAFARPTIEGFIPGLESYTKTSAVILIDNTFSMDVSDENGNRFKQAKHFANTILTQLKDGDEAAIIPFADDGVYNDNNFSINLESLKAKINSIEISNSKPDIIKSLSLAANLMESSFNFNKELFIISDFQSNIIKKDDLDSTKLFVKKNYIYIVPVGIDSKTDIANVSIDTINILTKIFYLNKPVELEVSVRNHSKKTLLGNVLNLYFNNDKISQRSFDLNADEVKTISFSAIPSKRGIYSAFLELESDALDVDNRRYFGFSIPEKPKIAIIGLPESYKYLRLALENQTNGENMSENEYYLPGEFASIDLNKFNLLVGVNGPFDESDIRRLEQYIADGGSALLFADDVTDATKLNTTLSKFGITVLPPKEFNKQQPAGFISTDKIHPLFEGVFKGTTDNKRIVESPKIYKSKPATGGQSIISMSSGNFLTEGRLGNGKLFYISVSPDEVWSNFPFTGLFPTIIYRSIVYLTSVGITNEYAEPGEYLNLSIPKRFGASGNFKIIDPTGTESFRPAAKLPAGSIISLEALRQFGVYKVLSPLGEAAALISVNPIQSESILKPLSKNTVVESLEYFVSDNSNIEFVDNPHNIHQQINRSRVGTELWQIFIIGALLCAIAEMLVERSTRKEI